MESKDFPRHINFTDAERAESFVLCALQALRTVNSVSKQCGFDITTRPELCLMQMKDMLPKLDDLMRISKTGDGNGASQIDSIAHDLVALALALRSGTLKSLNLPRESRYVSPSSRAWHLHLKGSNEVMFAGSLPNIINYADDVLRPHGDVRDCIVISEAVGTRRCGDSFYLSDIESAMLDVIDDEIHIHQGFAETLSSAEARDSITSTIRAVINELLPFKLYHYGRAFILSNLSEVDGKYVDKSNGMVLGEIGQ